MDFEGFRKYLEANNFPKVCVLMEDGTRVSRQIEYDHRTNSLKGIVAPLDEDGIPIKGFFQVSSPYKMAEDIRNYPIADTAYVQLAYPLAKGAAPYVLYYTATDNSFKADEVIKRWNFTEAGLRMQGIQVLGIAADGDPKVLKAMLKRTKNQESEDFGPWFNIAKPDKPINIQDIIHCANKCKNRLLKPGADMTIGK